MPEPNPVTYELELADIALKVTEWPGDTDPVLLLHATGFHSRCWDQIARLLPGLDLQRVVGVGHSIGGYLIVRAAVDELPNAREIYLPDMSHFIPMEDAGMVAQMIHEAAEAG